MTRHEQLVENYENALFELLMEGVVEREGERIGEEYVQSRNSPEFSVTPELDRRCLTLIKRACRKKRKTQFSRKTYSVLSKVAIVVFVVLVLFTSAYAAFPSVRVNVLNLLLEVSDFATTLRLEVAQPVSHENGVRKLIGPYTYYGIPVEFALISSNETLMLSRDYYENSDGAYLDISILQGQNTTHNINTENASYAKEIAISNFSGLLIARADETILALADADTGMFITLHTDCLSEAVLIEIANTFTYIGEI